MNEEAKPTVGIGVGLGGTSLVNRLISGLLFSVKPATCRLSRGSVPRCWVAVIASYLPARRATKVDPVVALRYE